MQDGDRMMLARVAAAVLGPGRMTVPAAAIPAPAETGRGLRGWLSRLATPLAAEHVCEPPRPGLVPVATECRRTDPEAWTCPECEQVYGARSARRA